MKKLLLALALTVMVSSPASAAWTRVIQDAGGNTWYVDFDRIKKHDGYVYYWELVDYLKPDESGTLSSQAYIQSDCGRFRFKILATSFHKQPMGGGSSTKNNENLPWLDTKGDQIGETVLKRVCAHK